MIDTIEPGEPATIEVLPVARRGVEIRLVLRAEGAEAPDDKLVALVARSHRWLDQLTAGAIASIREIAQAEGIDGGDVSRFLPLALALLNDPIRLSRELPSLSADDTRRLLKGATELASGTEGHDQTGAMLPALLRRVTVSGGIIRIELSNRALLDGTTGPGMIDTIEPGEPATIEVPFQLRRRGVEIRLVLRAEGAEAPDDKLVALVARSHRWLDQLTSGAIASIREIAQAEGIDGGDVSRFLPLAFLAPESSRHS